MNPLFLMLADMDVSDMMDAQKHFADTRLYEILATFGSIAAAVIIAVIWAVYYSLKKKKRKHHKHRHHHHAKSADAAAPAEDAAETPPPAEEVKTRRKWKRQRRPHRPLNPTLAQTRGLPPMRDENTPLPPMP
jgi:cell division protein FtsN